MDNSLTTPTSRLPGRLAGVAYLAIILFSIFGYTTVTRLLAGTPTEALARVGANQALFTAAFAANLAGLVAWVAVGLLLYRLMGHADRRAATLLLACVAGGVVVSVYAFWQLLPVVRALVGSDAARFSAMVDSYQHLLLLAQLFSGLWLLPFGWLIVRSRVAPRFLGVCLFIGGFGYILLFATAFAPGLDQMLAYRIVSGALGVPAMVGEFGICLWFLIKGAVPVPARHLPTPAALDA